MKRIHRVVVLPDYQGIGVGIRLCNEVAKLYRRNRYRLSITTSSPSLLANFKKYGWICTRFGRANGVQAGIKALNRTNSAKRVTASFEYVLTEK